MKSGNLTRAVPGVRCKTYTTYHERSWGLPAALSLPRVSLRPYKYKPYVSHDHIKLYYQPNLCSNSHILFLRKLVSLLRNELVPQLSLVFSDVQTHYFSLSI